VGIPKTCRLAGRYLVEVVPRKGLEPLRHFRGSGFEGAKGAFPFGQCHVCPTLTRALGTPKMSVALASAGVTVARGYRGKSRVLRLERR